MQVKGDVAPDGAFGMETMPKNPKKVLVRFWENAQPYSETTDDGQTTSGYEYDEWCLVLDDRAGLESEIAANLEAYLAWAKNEEAERNIIPRLREENASLQTSLVDAELALCELYEMIGG